MKWLLLAVLAVGKSPDLTADDLANPFNFMTGGALSESPAEGAQDDIQSARAELNKAVAMAKMATLQVQEATEAFTAHGRSADALRKEAKGKQLSEGAKQHLDSGLALVAKAQGASSTAVTMDDEHLKEDAQNAVNAVESAAAIEKEHARDAAAPAPAAPKLRHRRFGRYA